MGHRATLALLDGDVRIAPERRTPRPSQAPPAPVTAAPAPHAVQAPSTAAAASLVLVPSLPADDPWTAAVEALDAPLEAGSPHDDAEEGGWTSREVVDESLAPGVRAEVSTRQDPLGAWLVSLDDHLRASWVWPPEARALGAVGTVIVRLRVRASGRVDTIVLVRGSGDAALDAAALAALPSRTAPLPAGRDSLHLRYTFRYRRGNGAPGPADLPQPPPSGSAPGVAAPYAP